MKTFIVLALSAFSVFTETLTNPFRDLTFSTDMDGRIINGYLNKPGEIPYIVSIFLNGEHHCGGSIIDHEWILTAAHCFLDNPSNVTIVYGTINWSKPVITHFVEKKDFYVHKEFNLTTQENDIALIRTPYVEFSDLINKVDLPDFANKPLVGLLARASGWGRTIGLLNITSPLLSSVDMLVVPNVNCTIYNSTLFNFTDKHLCTNVYSVRSTCYGDSGGPLVLNENLTPNNKPVLIGVTSFGDYFCPRGGPSGFTRVSKFLPWIYETMQSVN